MIIGRLIHQNHQNSSFLNQSGTCMTRTRGIAQNTSFVRAALARSSAPTPVLLPARKLPFHPPQHMKHTRSVCVVGDFLFFSELELGIKSLFYCPLNRSFFYHVAW